MPILTASALLNVLGWALVNSLWQFFICWLLYRLLTNTARPSAAIRHTLALGLLLLGTGFFLVSLCWNCYYQPLNTGISLRTFTVTGQAWYDGWVSAKNTVDKCMPYWSLLYLACIVLLFVKFCFFVRRAGSLRSHKTIKMPAGWRVYINKIAGQLGIQQPVSAFLSHHIDTPQVIGFLKPVILVPAACLTNLSTEQLEAILLHELVHIRRNDYLINLFVAAVEILFFFNPFVKKITAGIRKEREYSCDDMVMQFQYHPHNYAAALLTLEKNRLMAVTYGIAASGKNQKQLLTRIERILGINNRPGGFSPALTSLLLLLFVVLLAGTHTKKGLILPPPASTSTGFAGNTSNAWSYSRTTGNPRHYTAYPGARPTSTGRKTIASTIKADPTHALGDETIHEVTFTTEPTGNDEAQQAAAIETVDFSLPSSTPARPPDALADADDNPAPFVPNNSFSYQVTQDTSSPKIKGETYNERNAREALAKTRKALAQLNWQAIEKNLKSTPQLLAKLRKQLTLQLQNLDWQRINTDVQDELQQEQLQKLQNAIQQGQVIKQFQQQEAYNEALQRQLADQEQLIKSSEQRMQDTQKQILEKNRRLQTEMKKRRIIYI